MNTRFGDDGVVRFYGAEHGDVEQNARDIAVHSAFLRFAEVCQSKGVDPREVCIRLFGPEFIDLDSRDAYMVLLDLYPQFGTSPLGESIDMLLRDSGVI